MIYSALGSAPVVVTDDCPTPPAQAPMYPAVPQASCIGVIPGAPGAGTCDISAANGTAGGGGFGGGEAVAAVATGDEVEQEQVSSGDGQTQRGGDEPRHGDNRVRASSAAVVSASGGGASASQGTNIRAGRALSAGMAAAAAASSAPPPAAATVVLPMALAAEEAEGLEANPELAARQRQERLALLEQQENQISTLEQRHTQIMPQEPSTRREVLNSVYRHAEDILAGTEVGNSLFGRRTEYIGKAPPRQLAEYMVEEDSVLLSPTGSCRYRVQYHPIQRHGSGRRFQDLGTVGSRAAAEALAQSQVPPVWVSDSATTVCMICEAEFKLLKRRHHCRNCGAAICDACSPARWPTWALPATYVTDRGFRNSVRVCLSCDDDSKAFREAVLAGDVDAAQAIHENSGNVNIRSPFPYDADRAFPVHIAAQKGAIGLLHWLVITKHCPTQIRTVRGDTPLVFAAACMNVDTMSWLVRVGAASVKDIADREILLGALHAALETHQLDPDTERSILTVQHATTAVAADAGYAQTTNGGGPTGAAVSIIAEPIAEEEDDEDHVTVLAQPGAPVPAAEPMASGGGAFVVVSPGQATSNFVSGLSVVGGRAGGSGTGVAVAGRRTTNV